MDSFNRFQEIRQQALLRQNRIENPREKLLDVIDRKKTEAAPSLVKTEKNEVAQVTSPTAQLVKATLKTANELLLYDQEVNTTGEISGTKNLGNYVDMVG